MPADAPPDRFDADVGERSSMTRTRQPHARRPSAALASVLSFVVPGLGQLSAGAWRRGLLVALPFVVLLGALAVVSIVDRSILVRAALTPPVLLALVAASVAVGIYRGWAILDAYQVATVPGRGAGGLARAGSLAVLGAVLALTVAMHAWGAYVGWTAHGTLTAVFSPTGPQGAGPLPTESATPTPLTAAPTPSTSPAASPTPVPTPVATPTPTPEPDWAADGRLNVLLIGSDAGPGRWSMRADAIILASVEIETGRVAAFSIPRYTTNVPLPDPAASAFPCRCLAEPINALYVYANKNPQLFPGDEIRGFLALEGATEALFDIELDGMAVVDLNGFVRLVDAIGGITVDVPAEVYDPAYPDPDGVTEVEVYFPAGVQEMNGWEALAYARTRHQDGDVSRMARQQHVVKALQRELGCDILGNLTSVLEVARETLWTTVPLADVPEMIRIDPGPVESHSLWTVHDPALTPDDVARVQAAVAAAFDGPAPQEPPEPEC